MPFSKACKIFLTDKERSMPPPACAYNFSKTATTDSELQLKLLRDTLRKRKCLASRSVPVRGLNDCYLQHISTYTSMLNTSPTTSGTANDSRQPLDPVRLLALVTRYSGSVACCVRDSLASCVHNVRNPSGFDTLCITVSGLELCKVYVRAFLPSA